jgi:hypothetical protein
MQAYFRKLEHMTTRFEGKFADLRKSVTFHAATAKELEKSNICFFLPFLPQRMELKNLKHAPG